MIRVLLILIGISSINAQEIIVYLNDYEQPYTLPVDTIPWSIYTEFSGYPLNMEFIFPNNNVDTVEYYVGGIVNVENNWDIGHIYDTLAFEVTSHSLDDSLAVIPWMFDGDSVLSIHYINYPGDNSSGFSLLAYTTTGSFSWDFTRLWYSSNEGSDWSEMQPMAVGNTWRFYGPIPEYIQERWEIISEEIYSDTTYYSLARERIRTSDYGGDGSVIYDTSMYFTVSNQHYEIYHYSGEYIGYLMTDFSPIYFPPDGNIFETFVFYEEGNYYFERWSESGPGSKWKYGVGFKSFNSGFMGTITNLVGYRIEDNVSGDIDNLVGIDVEPQKPEAFALDTYPNPFNNEVNILFNTNYKADILLEIHNLKGASIHKLLLPQSKRGNHHFRWNGKNTHGDILNSGVYIITVSTDTEIATKKILLLK